MKVHSIIRKGSEHPVFCEDFIATNNHGRYFIGVVFDGCSGGNESHFASSLMGKVFRQVLYSGYMSGESIEDRAKDFMKKFVSKLFEVKVVLNLEDADMLATFMMLVYDKVHGEAITVTIGDGVICCDGNVTIIENKVFEFSYPDKYRDMPNYIAYDLVELGLNKSHFDYWYDKFVTVTKYVNPQDISISTDGILTFNTPTEDINIVDYLLISDQWVNNKIMLSKKINILRTKYETVHKDDVSVIRLIINLEEDDNGSN